MFVNVTASSKENIVGIINKRKTEGKNNEECVFTRFKWHYASLQHGNVSKNENIAKRYMAAQRDRNPLFAAAVICPLVQYCQNEPVIARPKVYDHGRNRRAHSRILKKTRR